MPWCTLCRGTTVFQIECALVSFHNLDIVYKSLLCLQLESSFIENLSNKKTWAKWNCIDNSKLLKSIWTEIWQSYICLHITQDNSFCFNFSCFLSMARRDPAGGGNTSQGLPRFWPGVQRDPMGMRQNRHSEASSAWRMWRRRIRRIWGWVKKAVCQKRRISRSPKHPGWDETDFHRCRAHLEVAPHRAGKACHPCPETLTDQERKAGWGDEARWIYGGDEERAEH